MLWEVIKEKMLQNPLQKVYEGNTYMTFEEIVVYVEEFAQNLDKKCYAILCRSQIFTGISVLACLAAGVTAVPLSYKYGYNHLKSIVDYINPPNVISDIGYKLHIVDTDIGEYRYPKCSPAFIMCTSGSTGTPKGVMLSEENIYSNILGIEKYFNIDNLDIILISRPIYHCAVLTGEFLYSLYRGVAICFNDCSYNPSELVNTIVENHITVFCSTPTVFTMLSKFGLAEKAAKQLKTLVISGEILHKNSAIQISKVFDHHTIHHVYGLTEASPRVGYLSPHLFPKSGNRIDKFLDGLSIRIVDEIGNDVCIGNKGELIVKGDSIMLGYYKPKMSQRSNIEDGWLHTNDIVVRNNDGSIEFVGRKDDLIIRAGMNIYPSEIENILKNDSRVNDVVAYAITDKHIGVQIGINISGDFLDKNEVFVLCKESLPSYAIPIHIELHSTIPQNGSCKAIRNSTK